MLTILKPDCSDSKILQTRRYEAKDDFNLEIRPPIQPIQNLKIFNIQSNKIAAFRDILPCIIGVISGRKPKVMKITTHHKYLATDGYLEPSAASSLYDEGYS
ncbi:hypothetical protein EYC80_009145 [Monilinia laxa]|uniref:Uncharacterized protein n=1 Tax=Monilinia laxa TaxID=61186 RepID=A0A5N6K2L2_MONLA|nr:hypothetical protein EYC80_009145 [Monilinia laxa]